MTNEKEIKEVMAEMDSALKTMSIQELLIVQTCVTKAMVAVVMP